MRALTIVTSKAECLCRLDLGRCRARFIARARRGAPVGLEPETAAVFHAAGMTPLIPVNS